MHKTGLPLVDMILDKTGQNGTGKWTSIQAIDNGIPVSIITESLIRTLPIPCQKRNEYMPKVC